MANVGLSLERLDFLLNCAITAAQGGGAALLERYGKKHEIIKKGPVNLVTEADLASERVIKAILHEKTPELAIMSEEHRASHSLDCKQSMWVVDPLDGTANFAHGFPFFAVSIALLQAGTPLAGVVYAPLLNELFCARQGGGATLCASPISVSKTETLIASLVATGFPYERGELPAIMRRLHRVLSHVQDVRRSGSAAIDLAYLASGRLDAFYETGLKPWDTAAGWLLVMEAGGTATGMDGRPYSPFAPHILATNSRVHPGMLALLQDTCEESP